MRALELYQKNSLLRCVREGADNSLNLYITQNHCLNHNSFILSPPNLSYQGTITISKISCTISLTLRIKRKHASNNIILRLTHKMQISVRMNIRIYSIIRIFSSEYCYSYSIRGNFQSQILFEYSNIFVRIFPNIGL